MKTLILFTCGLLLTSLAWSQVEIKGSVLDENNEPISDASVFLNNTSYATNTLDDGSYLIEVPEGNYELIVYQFGYSAISHPFEADQSLELNFKLEPVSVDLVAHEVSASRDPSWYKNLEVFKRTFLGVSRNGRACELINASEMILDGDPKSNTLKAWANSPLIIRNKHLGYMITYILEAYERNESISSYLGYVTYSDIPDMKLKKRHINARERAYKGSNVHFIRSLIAGTSEEEGFQIEKFKRKNWEWELVPATFDEILSYEEDGVYLNGSGRYQITYQREKPELAYSRVPDPTGRRFVGYGQVSEIEFLEEKVKLSASGSIDPPLGILFSGYMGWEKLGDAIPLNYQP